MCESRIGSLIGSVELKSDLASRTRETLWLDELPVKKELFALSISGASEQQSATMTKMMKKRKMMRAKI